MSTLSDLEVLTACVDELEAEIEERYPPDQRKYPDMQRKYECEMRMVTDARAALARVAQLEEMYLIPWRLS